MVQALEWVRGGREWDQQISVSRTRLAVPHHQHISPCLAPPLTGQQPVQQANETFQLAHPQRLASYPKNVNSWQTFRLDADGFDQVM